MTRGEIPRPDNFSPYRCKAVVPLWAFHAAATIANGVAPTVVQNQMRHSDARITLGAYGHVLGDAQRVAVEEHAGRIEKFSVQ
jgi:integrase